jgi:predicted nucleic acid-binding protein
MQVVDTVVFFAYQDERDPRFARANEYVYDIGLRRDLYVPSATMFEFDLELKNHGVKGETRADIHTRLAHLIPQDRFLPITSSILGRAAELSKLATWRDSYFDTLIAATGLENGAESAITTDRRFSRLGIRPVF